MDYGQAKIVTKGPQTCNISADMTNIWAGGRLLFPTLFRNVSYYISIIS